MQLSTCGVVLALLLLPGCATARAPATTTLPLPVSDSETELAKEAAGSWLVLVDAGEYDRSWTVSSSMFSRAVTRQQWHQAMEAVRQPLGSSSSRILKSARRTRTVPAAPDGDYFVLEYESSFSGKASAKELLTVVLEADHRWRVAGYFIR